MATAEQLTQQGHRREAILLYEKVRGLDSKAGSAACQNIIPSNVKPTAADMARTR